MQQPAPPPHGPAAGGPEAAGAGAADAAHVPDERLVAELRAHGDGGGGDPFPEAALLARHGSAVHDYVSLFVPSGRTATAATSSICARAVERLRTGAYEAGALRPYFLVTAREVLDAWAGNRRIAVALPGIQRPGALPENRRLVAHAFSSLPVPAQVLLWHREVEAEGLSIPAALLGIDPRDAGAQLDEARELLRVGCADAHHELAPGQECRHFGRLLDISLRRTGRPLIPDIQRHLVRCRFCRHTADQLRHGDGRLPLLLAEALLGEGAARYLDSRPGRGRTRGGPGDGLRRAGRHASAVRRRLRRPGGGTLLTGLGAGVTGLLVLVAVAALWPDGERGGSAAGGGAGRTAVPPSVSGGASGEASVSGGVSGAVPGLPSGTPPGGPPGDASGSGAAPSSGAATGPVTASPSGSFSASSPAPAGYPVDGTLRTRLRNAAGGGELCLDVHGGAPRDGAELVLAPCTGAGGQLWVYDADGLLRSAAAPHLCPDSGRLDGTVVLTGCAAGDRVRYDITIQGAVVPRHADALALAPVTAAAGSGVVVRVRDGAPEQRWLTDAPPTGPAQPGVYRAADGRG
ncbi:RICIN domain-containing protein [Streptomyces sp. TRM64462]|uniref:RICIN domain-containing protein n=1 Tax=Streptomyces sp. TRM64462 TaxID=2741726 RepID=UPI00158628D1|nr:RICIN domain-containing protein [Streptomyces sp. TRM64462]